MSSPTPGTRSRKPGASGKMSRLPTVCRVFLSITLVVFCQIVTVKGQTTSTNVVSMVSPIQANSTGEMPNDLVSNDGQSETARSLFQSSTQSRPTTPPPKPLSTVRTQPLPSVRMPPDIVTEEAPVINRGPAHETVLLGRRITLQCRASGNPTPDITWEKDSHDIPPGRKNYVIKENRNLRILSASLEDAGAYRCIATSRVGKDVSAPANVVVEMKARITKGPSNYNVSYGTMLNLTCAVEGYPKPRIVWLKRGSPIRGSEDKSFLVLNATISENYTCLASNKGQLFDDAMVKEDGRVIVTGRPNFCAPYNGLVCRSVLGTKRVFYNATLEDPPGKLERSVKDLLTQTENSVMPPCQKALENLVCHQAYPDCEEVRGVPPVPQPLSMEDCKVVKENMCRNDLAKLRNSKNQLIIWGPGEGNLGLPDCDALPSKTRPESKYTDVQLFPEIVEDEVTKDCIVGVGHYYMGTVNTTRDGLLCQPWEAQHPHSHLYYPTVYPELRNASNYCRNPGGMSDSGPWCFTLNRDIAWQFCDIPKCVKDKEPSVTDAASGISELPGTTMQSVREVPGPRPLLIIICVVAAGGFGLLVMVCFAYRRWQYQKRFANYKYPIFDHSRLPENPLFGKDLNKSFNTKLQYLEYPRNDIMYMRDIGEGAFGRVFQATTPRLIREEEKTVVAIKMLKADAERDICDYFNREAEIISRFNHPNIIQLLGICFVGKPLCLILEYMGEGDLQEFLQSHHPYASHKRSKSAGPKYHIDLKVQLQMAKQVACGLVYLTEKRFVHRDIATRNCLVNSNLDVKISDFGLAQYLGGNNLYIGHKDETIPIRWTAPEALWQYHFTTYSDVWSFGVLLWEIFSYAQQPYAAMSHEQVFIQTHQGHTLSQPSNTPSAAYDLMQKCWALEKTERPTFHTVADTLSEISTELEASSSSSSPDTSVVSIES